MPKQRKYIISGCLGFQIPNSSVEDFKSSTAKRIIFTVITSIFITFNAFAQINNSPLENPIRLDSNRRLSFRFSSLNFVKNNEYFNDLFDGYTIFGYFINPKIAFHARKNVVIELGGFARKEFGSKGFKEIEPTFSIKYQKQDWQMIFGNLEGNVAHQMIEPMMNFERMLTAPLEHGFQFKKVESDAFFDSWLDWQRSTLAGQTNQEHILFGVVWKHKPFEISNLKVNFPVQFTAYHQGGQNLAASFPVKTWLNPSVGVSVEKELLKSSISFENQYVGSFEDGNVGKGWYSNLKFQNIKWQAILSYWLSENYASPMGGDLFQSASRKFNNESYSEQYRSLLILRLIRDWKIVQDLNLSFRFEPYYDFRNHLFQHSEGLYLKYSLQ